MLPDALSRLPAPPGGDPSADDAKLMSLALEPTWLAKVHEEQRKDTTLAPYFERGQSTDASFALRTVQGVELLYRQPKADCWQLVIPDGAGLRQLLLQEFHCTPLAGHMGARKVISALQQRFWWPRLTIDVRTFIRGCQTCQRAKDSTQASPGQLAPLPTPERRFQTWTMDFITGLPMHKGLNGIFVCVEKLTKLVKLIPCSVGGGSLSAE